jgi:hypothetical protein
VTESKNWRPGHWSENAIRLRMKRVCRYAAMDLAYLIGPHAGNIVVAELVARMKSDQSANELHRRGFKTIGDVARELRR